MLFRDTFLRNLSNRIHRLEKKIETLEVSNQSILEVMDAAVVTVTTQKHAIDTGYEHLNFMSDLIREILRNNPHLLKEDDVQKIFKRYDEVPPSNIVKFKVKE